MKALHSKGNHKTKRQPSEWGKIAANEAMNKGFTSRIYKQLNRKWTDLNRHFSKRHMKKMIDITITKMQTPQKWPLSKNKGCGEKGTLALLVGM